MGIYLCMYVSESITKKEWADAYQGTLGLISHLPLVEMREADIDGYDTVCLMHSEERTADVHYGRDKVTGWYADGDGNTLICAENFFLPRDLVDDERYNPDAGDAVLTEHRDYPAQYKEDDGTYCLWGSKTQGEPYHMYLLAAAAYLSAKLGSKIWVTGDVTKGQFRRAVEIASKYLEEPIDLPDNCDPERWFRRTSALPLQEDEKLGMFVDYYLGNTDASFGEFLRIHYPEEVTGKWWEKQFSECEIGSGSFDEAFGRYLLWGFDLQTLCQYVRFNDDDSYREFVTDVMDARMYQKDKYTGDILKINQEEEHPYSIATLFAQFVFGGARNKKVDRYMPLEDIRCALKAGIGEHCDVDSIIDDYLRKEAEKEEIHLDAGASEEEKKKALQQDPAEAFHQIMENERAELTERVRKYDIVEIEQLLFYEAGDTLEPGLAKSLKKSMDFLHSLLKEPQYEKLMQGKPEERCSWLAERSIHLLVREQDWKKVYADVLMHPESFSRYYPLFRAIFDHDHLSCLGTALMVNDDFHAYAEELADREETV